MNPTPLQIVARKVLSRVRRMRTLTRWVFGVRIDDTRHIHWDFTTLLLHRTLLECTNRNQNMLEMGTGPFALLSISLGVRGYTQIVAVDVNASHVASARSTAGAKGVPVKIVQSDLFASIDGCFDVVFWNSVYIPRALGHALHLDHLHGDETDWCGGVSGTETIERFLRDAAPHLAPRGQIFLGFNTVYQPVGLVRNMAAESGYAVRAERRSRLNPSCVLILGRSPDD